jgi:asparagine synthase (glutamine-hydrolysing)
VISPLTARGLDDRLRPRPLELASSLMLGLDDDVPLLREAAPGVTPRAALEAACLGALQLPHCVVAFSGGRDSSAMLAIATHVARREGLPLPVPVTLRFAGVAEADESQWQELVIRHLGLPDWTRLELGDDLDFLGPSATRVLRTHGVLAPVNTYASMPLLECARGGSYIDGVDGDSVLSWRHEHLAKVMTARAAPRRDDAADLRLALSPRPLRDHWAARTMPWTNWLTRPAAQQLRAEWAKTIASQPWSYARSLQWQRRSRAANATDWGTLLLAADVGTTLVRPFADDAFLTAFGRSMPAFGFRGRTQAFASLVGDLLPESVVTRHSKATFPHYWGTHSARFAAEWTGAGVDPAIVDLDNLRSEWASPRPSHRTGLLLQQAWLHATIPAK